VIQQICNLIAPFLMQYLAQSNMVADNSMMLPSRLNSLSLKRNLRWPSGTWPDTFPAIELAQAKDTLARASAEKE